MSLVNIHEGELCWLSSGMIAQIRQCSNFEWSSVNQRCAYMFVSFVDFGVSFVDCVFQSKYLLMRFSYVFLQTCDFGKFVFSELFLR